MSSSVVTLIAAPAGAARLDAALAAVRRGLRALGAEVGAVDWLAPGIACDVLFDGLDLDQADAAVGEALGGLPIDRVVQRTAGRRKRLLVADMESTIIENEMLEELADYLGLREPVAEITRQAMNGEMDFIAALEARVALLKGLPASALDDAAGQIRVMPGGAALVATMRRVGGAKAALVSGGFRCYTAIVRDQLGFDFDVANELPVEEGRIAGFLVPPVVTRETKLETLKQLAAQQRLPLADTLAVGDGANDLPMIEAAGLGVAFHAKPAVAARARARIDHGDLTALLYAQGYRAEDIVAP
jgi:phosphoserine phosphatase